MSKTTSSVLGFGFFLMASAAAANCELSWVQETDKTQNWIHTVATYPEASKRVYTLVPSASGKGESLTLAIGDQKAKALEPHPLSAVTLAADQKATQAEIESALRGMSELKALEISSTYQVNADVSRTPVKSVVIYQSSKLRDASLAEVKLQLKMSDVPKACEKGCKEPNRLIDFPVILLKTGANWKLFGHGRLGTCSAFKSEAEAPLEAQLVQTYGLPTHYTFYDSNGDGKADILQLSSRPHLPGTVTLYNLISETVIEVDQSEFCVKSIGACFPEPGC